MLRGTTTQRSDTFSRRKPHWQGSRWSHRRNQKTDSLGRKNNGRQSDITQHEAGSCRNRPQLRCSTSRASWHLQICYNVSWVWRPCKLHWCDVLTRWIADAEIQLDLFGDKKQDMTLEELFKFVEANEAAKRSASRLIDNRDCMQHLSKKQAWKASKTKTVPNLMCVHIAKGPEHVYVKQRDKPTDTHAASVIVIITWNMYVGARTNPKSRKITLTMEVQYLISSALFMITPKLQVYCNQLWIWSLRN